ncbi:MAG TPA: thioesterase family protein [Kofleriaceae bacterium]|jgi:acyl-CoA thioesterase
MSADLVADTAVREDATVPGRYHVTLPDHWDYLMPSGGVVMTCALRAAAAAAGDPRLALVSATSIFCTPIASGPLVVDTHVLRRGGSTAQVRVALRDGGGEPGAEVIATFARTRRGPDVRGAAFPKVRALADATSTDDGHASNPHARFRFYQQIETRIADGAPFWTTDFAAGPATYARWMRYRAMPRTADGLLDRLALPPLIDTMPTALHRAIGPGAFRFYAPSLDLTTYVVDDTAREWLLVATRVPQAKGGYAIGEVDVWDDEGRYLAHGAQAMYLHALAGEPPVIDASHRV